nr:hypothetical protein [uncultured Desulfobacter sp.]
MGDPQRPQTISTQNRIIAEYQWAAKLCAERGNLFSFQFGQKSWNLGTVCGNSARTDLWGRRWATGASTRKRANHENDIDQLKHGVHAMDNPSDSLNANWAYMVIASLAWDLKAWYGMMMPYRSLGLSIVRMEFKRFIQTFINIPCLIIRSGRTIKYRIIAYNNKLSSVFKLFNSLRTVRVT